jgi:hypothetical protein
MPELARRTARIRRGWLDRLRGFNHLYQTEVTDGHHVATGRGTTPSASAYAAQRLWETRFGQSTEMTEFDPPSPAQLITLSAGDSMSLGKLREAIDALRADNGRLLRLLIKRYGRQEHKSWLRY